MEERTSMSLLQRLKLSKERKIEDAKEAIAFLKGVHYGRTGVMLKESEFQIW